MITKVERIQGLGVFSDFTWDQEVQKPDGQVEIFKHINIIYGRNYSGKTTLSRLLRAMETQDLSDKYGAPQFRLLFDDGSVVDETNYQACRQKVRVFNEDFVRDNLKFIANPHDSIEPFAVIGDDNIVLEQEIDTLLAEIGSDEDGSETGLKAQLKSAKEKEAQARKAHGDADGSLNGSG